MNSGICIDMTISLWFKCRVNNYSAVCVHDEL